MGKKVFEKSYMLVLLCFILAAFTAKAGGFDLKINDVSGVDSPWPLTGSMAFHKGEIKDASSIRITSGGREIPSQIDVTATWRDGSVRWALAGFTASPQGKYRVEYGAGVKRTAFPNPLKVTRDADGNFTVDTGAAVYQFDKNSLLPERAWLVCENGRIPVLEGSGAGTYLADNSGRTARVAGAAAAIENTVLKDGPGRFVVKRSGWYITQSGEKLARADVWLYFAAGTPYVRITHSLILTEDTNKVWFKDYGLEFKTPAPPADVYCAAGAAGEESVQKVKGSEVFLLQDVYPHFAEREYKAGIGISENGTDRIVEKFNVAGDWAYGDYGNYGIAVVMPWLAERFPKEISFGERGARAVLWSGRSGRELDFRAKTLVEEYWQRWAKEAPGAPKNPHELPSNAQGTALTHDIWLLPQAGNYRADTVRKTAIAGARPPLALSDTAQICSSEAIGWPSLHRDPAKFPEAEQMISDHWQRFIMSMKAFPMTGVISWGCFPDVSVVTVKGRIMSGFGDSRLKGIMDYGMRRVPFLMYARSGERECYEYGYRFSRFTGDYGIAHWNSPNKERGVFIVGDRGGLPFFWQGRTVPFSTIDGEIRHWLNDYYLTGDERSLGLVKMVQEYAKKANKTPRGIVSISRTLLTLSVMDWDDNICRMTREFVHSIIDIKSQNGLKGVGLSPEYKDERDTYDLLEYYLETGDEPVKEAWLKLLDQKYRFERRSGPIGHRNYDALTYCIAYMVTGEQRWRSVAEQTLSDALYYAGRYPFSEQVSRMPKNPLDWKSLPGRIWNEYENPFIGFPATLKLISEKGWSGEPITPLVVKPMKIPGSMLLFSHEKGNDTRHSIYIQTEEKSIKIEVSPYADYPEIHPVKDLGTEIEKRMSNNTCYHAYITMPADKESGLYLLSFAEKDTFTLLDTTSEKAVLFSPEGFWSASSVSHGSSPESSRPGEGKPMFFRVPEGLKTLEIFMGYPAIIRSPDGKIAVENSDSNVGKLSIPAEGRAGIWSIEPYLRSFKGDCPAGFYRLLNVEPMVAFGSPSLLPEKTSGKPVVLASAALPATKGPVEFVEGVQGKSVRLSEQHSLKFARGERLQQGGYAFFPGNKGTVEFWFRPDHSILNIALPSFKQIDLPFVKAPLFNLQHSYWRRGTPGPFSFLQTEFLSEKGEPTRTGFQAEYFYRAGKWVHIAYTWDIKEGDRGLEASLGIFLNGRKLPHRAAMYGINPVTGKQKIKLSDAGEDIVLGPFEGAMDNLRISDTVRYTADFQPGKEVPAMDLNTRALFLFDGNLKGISASSQPLEALRQ